jgi:hypothetical protein
LSYNNNCPARTTHSSRKVPWWNKKLSGLRAKTRRLFNAAKRTGHWDMNKEVVLTFYNKEIRKAIKSLWRTYCQEIADVPDSDKIRRTMAKEATNRISTIKLPDGKYTKT